MSKIERTADGMNVICYTDGHPPSFTVTGDDSTGPGFYRLSRQQAEGLRYALDRALDDLSNAYTPR